MSKYIAAISGGPDSMTMLHMYQKQIVAVCHINYKKRLSADRDMRIVQEFCKKSGIPFECMIVTKNEYDKYFNITNNFQTVARMIRYDFFIKNVKKHKADAILVAHNKDDFLETAFLQMKRKSKTLFLGIEKNSMYKGVKIYRPLLNK
jgi:tRNA(Ile)-lysidine synthase